MSIDTVMDIVIPIITALVGALLTILKKYLKHRKKRFEYEKDFKTLLELATLFKKDEIAPELLRRYIIKILNKYEKEFKYDSLPKNSELNKKDISKLKD